jgi:hypothetical protein
MHSIKYIYNIIRNLKKLTELEFKWSNILFYLSIQINKIILYKNKYRNIYVMYEKLVKLIIFSYYWIAWSMDHPQG